MIHKGLYKCIQTVPSRGIVNTVGAAILYMTVNEIHHSQMHPLLTGWLLMRFITL